MAPRRYYRESILGNLLANLLRAHAGTDIGLVPAGAIRADLAAGEVTVEEVLNVFPFTDRVSILEVPGSVVREVLEKSLSLEYGLVQFSGLVLTYDGAAPAGQRLRSVTVAGEPLDDARRYTLATGSFTATGGENYGMFRGWPLTISDTLVSDALIAELKRQGTVNAPATGRQTDLARQVD